MSRIRALALAVAVGAVPGCTTQAWYEGIKSGAEQNCRVQPESERERCEARRNKATYEEYETMRKGL